ncbi:MAG: DUF2281 domain-containing protein [Fimbriimonadales bacterium]|nr:DUF2281 domain-containing protein [Fimbriimonadales bacterium]
MPAQPMSLEELIRALPPEAQEQTREYIEALYYKHQPKQARPLKLDWAGALAHLRDQYTPVELQHEILKEWGD